VRKPTRATRILQISLPIYFIIVLIVAWTAALPAVHGFLDSGQLPQAVIEIAILTVTTVATAVLAYGSLRTWRWVFWLFLIALTFSALFLIQNAIFHSTRNLRSNVVGTLLLIACVVSVVIYGPWAMRKESVSDAPAT